MWPGHKTWHIVSSASSAMQPHFAQAHKPSWAYKFSSPHPSPSLWLARCHLISLRSRFSDITLFLSGRILVILLLLRKHLKIKVLRTWLVSRRGSSGCLSSSLPRLLTDQRLPCTSGGSVRGVASSATKESHWWSHGCGERTASRTWHGLTLGTSTSASTPLLRCVAEAANYEVVSLITTLWEKV